MSSLIHSYLLLFISFSLNTSLIHSERRVSCIKIGNSSISSDNMCLDETDGNQTILFELSCRIKTTFRMKTDGCPRNYPHMILTFSDNSVFETFFEENREIIKHLFQERNNSNTVTFHIIIESHNITKITWNYVNSILKTDPQVYTELWLVFRQINKSAPQPEIGDDFIYYKNSIIKVQIPCGDDEENMYYAIENGSMVFKENKCKPFFISYLLRSTENFNTAGENESHRIIKTTINTTIAATFELAATTVPDTTIKIAVESKISTLRTTELIYATEDKTTKEYRTMQLTATKLVDNMSSSDSNAAGITISTLSPMRTTAKITSRPVNITFSVTKSSKPSHTVLFLYLLPSLLIFSICFIIITICVILTHRRQHKLSGIIDQDYSVMSNIASTDISITRNNDSTSAISSKNNSTTYLSPLVKPIDKTVSIDKFKKHVTHIFDDNF